MFDAQLNCFIYSKALCFKHSVERIPLPDKGAHRGGKLVNQQARISPHAGAMRFVIGVGKKVVDLVLGQSGLPKMSCVRAGNGSLSRGGFSALGRVGIEAFGFVVATAAILARSALALRDCSSDDLPRCAAFDAGRMFPSRFSPPAWSGMTCSKSGLPMIFAPVR